MGNSDSNASLKTLYANYVSVKQLNDSRFGEGRIVRHKQTKEEHFQREINLTDEPKFKALKLYLERKIANPHPNILNLLKTYYSEDQQFCGQFFKIYLLLEFCPTTLYDLIENRILKKTPFTEDELWTILIGAIEGFARLEQSQITHQAIRPDTLSVRPNDLLVKVYDPTICNNITTHQILMTEDNYNFAYVSPQLMSALRDETKLVHNPYKSDVYSLGIVMLHTSSLQSCDDCYDYSKNKVLHQQVQKRINQIESQFSPQYIQILRTMLLLNEEQRPDFTQLKQEISELISEPPKQLQKEEEIYEIRSPTPKPVYEEVGMYQSFKSPTVIVKEELFPINKTEVSAKFIQPESNQLKQSITTPVSMQQGLRENLFRADKCDYIQHIKISEQPSYPSEPDNNVGNKIGAEENEDFLEEQVHDNTDIIENLMPVTSIQGSAQKSHYSLNQYDIQPISYDSYKIQREEYQPNRTQYQYETTNAHLINNNNNNSILTQSNQQKYEYLYDKQLSNQQKLSQYQQDIKKNFEITTSIRKETVVEHYPNGSSYEGEKLNGLRHGQGCFYYQDNGGVYEGQWFENKMHGQGTLFYASGKPAYEGQWVNDKFEGKGTLYNEEPHILNGEYDYKDFDRIGEYWCKYSGQFHEDNKEGLGTLYISNGEYFEGYFLQDLVSGPGKYYKKNGQKQTLWGNVFLFLNQKEIALSEQVCKFWYYLINSDTYWLRKIFKVFYCQSQDQFQWYKHKVKNLKLKELEFYECQIQLDSVQVQELLSYLNLEMLSIKVNNQQYLDIIFKQMNNLSIFETYGNVNDQQLEILANNNKIVELHLKNQKCQEYNKSLTLFKDLKCLSLLSYHQNFDYVHEILVNNFNTLTELEIEAEQLDNSQMNILLNSLNPEIINKLCIYYFEQYNDSHIQQMRQYKKLQKLIIRQAKDITELSCYELVKDKSFIEIDLTQCEGIDDNVLQQIIANSPNLESIKLGWIYSISDEIICLLFEKCNKLKEVVLTGCKQLTEKCIPKQLSFLKNLRYLEFKSCNYIEDELLQQIKNRFRYFIHKMNKDEQEQEKENDILSQSLQPYQPVLTIDSDIPDIKQDDGHLAMNKKDLLKQFTILFSIVLCIIFERVIYQFVVEEENTLIIKCQNAFNLIKTKTTPLGEMVYFDGNIIFDLAGSIHRNGINIMFFTNIFLTLYVGFDALLAMKIMYMSYTSVFLISYLQLLYSNPRPFWLKEEIVTSLCLPSYANPSSFFCQIGFTIFYTIYCYRIKNHTRSFKTYDGNFEKKVKIIQSIIFLFLIIYSFILFLMALQYIINTLLGGLYALIFYVFCVTFENQISNMVKHATIMNIDSKRYVMYISFILLISETIAVMSFSDEMEVIDINWTQNYMNCLYTTNQVAYEVPSQLLMGAKFTFEKTSIIFALIGALFGVSHSFRHIKTLEWYKGTVRKRIARVIVANICTIPGWIFANYLNDISLNHKIYEWGLSFFLMESVFFTGYYFILFAWLPLRVFRYLKLNALSSTSYVVVNLQD